MAEEQEEETIDIERDDIRVEAENKQNENLKSRKDELTKLNKAAKECRQEVKNMLKN